MKKLLNIVLILMLSTVLMGCGLQKDDVYIAYTSDIHGHVNNGMGYAGLKSYIDALKKEHCYVTLVDGGDFSEGEKIAENSKASAIYDIMNDVGYDIAALGNHELDYGLDALSQNLNKAKFDVLCTNIQYTGNKDNPLSKVKPYVIKKYGPIKIAYIGIMTPEVLLEDKNSRTTNMEDGNLVIDVYNDIYDSDGGDAVFKKIQETIDEVRNKVDYVVAIAHLGTYTKCALNCDQLIKWTTGIDIVLDAHAHTDINGEYWENMNGEKVLYFAVGCHLDKVGLIKIKTDGTFETSFVHEYETRDEKLQAFSCCTLIP